MGEHRRMRLFVATLALCPLLGCGGVSAEPDASGAPLDAISDMDSAGSIDAMSVDAGPIDGGSIDAGSIDAGSIDTRPASDDAPLATEDAPRCPPRAALGLFVWGDDLATRRDAILDLAEATGVTEIYLHANLFYAGDLDQTVLADWIRAASMRCVEVELLFGNARWILPAMQAQARERTDWVVRYAESHPDARPTGVHFDLEPQQLAEWDVMADRPGLVSHLVDVLESMKPVAESAGLRLSVDIGFFLDGYEVTRAGRARPGSEWITDAVSRVVIMDYRDSAESMGFGGMISLAEDEVAYASSAGTPIVLAAETGEVTPEYVSFREEGLAAMQTELAAVRAHFAASTSFAGLAIHDERGLRALPP